MLEGPLAPLRVVLQRSLADWVMVAATWAIIACATTLLAIGVLYGDAVALSGLRQILVREPAAVTSIAVQMRVDPEQLASVDEVVSRHSRRILGWADGELARSVRSGTYDLAGAVRGATDRDLAVFAAADRLEQHADLLEGSWPTSGADPIQAVVSSAAATGMELTVGDDLALSSRAGADRTVRLRIVGIWEPRDPADPYWPADRLDLDGASEGSSFTVHGPIVVAREDLVGQVAAGDLDVTWRTIPDFGTLALRNVKWMRSDTLALERRIRSELGDGAYFSVTTALPQVLSDADRSLLVSRSGVLILTIQFAILAGYALILVAGLLVEQRRIETALLRSRGASPGQVAWMAFLEGLLLVVPAAIAAPWVALGALYLFDAYGPLTAAGVSIRPQVDMVALLVSGAAGIACMVGLVLPAFASGRGFAAVRQTLGRQGSRTLPQRLGIDLALVVLAGIGLWQLRQYGAPLTASVRGTIGLDPLLVAAPAIGLLAGGILALRVVPLVAELGERLLSRGRGLVAPLGARQLARRPLRYTRSALLLMLAAALGTFAATYTTTWTRSQTDQASYQAGGDVRVEVSSFPVLPLWAIGAAYAGVDGVERALPVIVDTFDVSGQSAEGQLLALDAPTLPEVAEVRPDLLGGQTLDEVAAALAPDLGGFAPITLPGKPSGLDLRVTTAFENLPATDGDGNPIFAQPVAPNSPIGRVSIAVRDARGLVHTFDATERLQASAADQRIAVPLAEELEDGGTVRPDDPLQLIGIGIVLELPADTRVAGELEIMAVGAIDAGGAASAIDLAGSGDGWSWLLERGLLPPEPAPTAADDLARVGFTEAQALFGDEGPASLRLVPASLAEVDDRPLPIVISRSFADETQTGIGDTLALGSLTRRTQVEVIGIIDAFPTLDPDRSFAIVDAGGYGLATYARSGEDLFIDEWWLATSDESSVVEALREEPYSAERLTSRSDRAAQLTDDPVSLGVSGALLIGSFAALIVAVIGFVVSAIVSTRERLNEFALLRALGLSPGQLSAWLTLENAFLLAAGILAGIGLGLVLSWLVLPFVTLTGEARTVVPPVLVEVPWVAIGVVLLAAGAVLVLAVVVIGGILRRVPVSGVLRAGQD